MHSVDTEECVAVSIWGFDRVGRGNYNYFRVESLSRSEKLKKSKAAGKDEATIKMIKKEGWGVSDKFCLAWRME